MPLWHQRQSWNVCVQVALGGAMMNTHQMSIQGRLHIRLHSFSSALHSNATLNLTLSHWMRVKWMFFASRLNSGYSLWKPMLWHTPLYFPQIIVPWTVWLRFVGDWLQSWCGDSHARIHKVIATQAQCLQVKHLSSEHRCWKCMERADCTPVEIPGALSKFFRFRSWQPILALVPPLAPWFLRCSASTDEDCPFNVMTVQG